MVDTPRSVSALQTLLANNNAEGISEQDLRDFLVTALGVYGSLSCFEAVTEQTDIGTTGVKLTCFTTDGPSNGTTPAHADDEITVGVAGVYLVMFQAAFVGANGADMEFRLRKNGTEENFGTSRIANSTQNGSCSFMALLSLAVNDVLSIYVQSDTTTDDITVRDAQFVVRMVG